MKIETKITAVFEKLDALAERRIIFLEYENSFQLLIGVILSAQTTDRQVNEVLPALFARYPGPKELGEAELQDVIDIIRPVGFFNVKAGNIIKAAAGIHVRFGGRVPESMEDLLSLAGVGRKSANVIRGACFKLPAIIVDTHFGRTAVRLGLTAASTPDKIEAELSSSVPAGIQYRFSMLLNKLGRDYCKARKPLCGDCPVRSLCDYKDSL